MTGQSEAHDVTQTAYAHFIGIGGAGMSGIAQVLHERGAIVTGSDLKPSRYSRALSAAGVPVMIGHDASNVGTPQVVVVSTAIPESNPELVAARTRGIPVWRRAEMLAEVSRDCRTIAIAGTHGKTTTSAMAASTLTGMGLDPSFLVGGEVKGFDANAHGGTGDLCVVEADESDGSFTLLDPFIAVVTNVEADHLDFYDGIEAVEAKFAEFLGKVRPDGAAILCADDERLGRLATASRCRVLSYGFSADADVRCGDVRVTGLGHEFSVRLPDGTSISASVLVPGIHNVSNATSVLATAYALGLDVGAAARSLATFTGVRRRFDIVGEAMGVTIVDDYAHHPTEVKATLAAARQGAWRRVWVIFQPHRFSRTAALAEEFGQAFGQADRIVLMDVYSAGEIPVPGVNGKTVADAVLDVDPRSRVAFFPHRPDVAPYVASNVAPGDLVFTMGAGDVTALGAELLRDIEARGGSGVTAT